MKIGFKVLWGMPPGGEVSMVYEMTYSDPDLPGEARNVPYRMEENYFPDELLVAAGDQLNKLVATVDGEEVAIKVISFKEGRFIGSAPDCTLLLQLPLLSSQERTVRFETRKTGRTVPDSDALSAFSSFMVFNHAIEPVFDIATGHPASLLNSTEYPSSFDNGEGHLYDYTADARCREGLVFSEYGTDIYIDRTQIATWGYNEETDEEYLIYANLPSGVLGKNPTRFGGGSLFEGELYVCAEAYDGCASVTDKLILVYDPDTLVLKRSINFTGSEEVSAITCVNGFLYVASKCSTTSIYRYTLNWQRDSLSSRTVLTLKSPLKNMEGMCPAGSGGRYLLITSDDLYNLKIYCLDTVTMHRWCVLDISSKDDVDGDHRIAGIQVLEDEWYFSLDSEADGAGIPIKGMLRVGPSMTANPNGPVPMFSTDLEQPQATGAMIINPAFLSQISPPGTYCVLGRAADMLKYQQALRMTVNRRWEGYNTKDGVFAGYDVPIADGSTYGAEYSYPGYYFGPTERSVMFGETTTNGPAEDLVWRYTTGPATYSEDGQLLDRFVVLGNGVNTTRQMRGGTVQHAMLLRESLYVDEITAMAITRMWSHMIDTSDVELVGDDGSVGGDSGGGIFY